uniref:Putative monolaris n=1 Tax=Rhipicephalus pulchellus TaxID=72859 RepID=L7LQQ1_RHIPC
MRVLLLTFVTYFTSVHPDGMAHGSSCHAMPKEEDECEPDITKWYWNRNEGGCRNFMYGECEPQGNSFATKEKCEEFCKSAGKGPQAPEQKPWPPSPPKRPPTEPSPPEWSPPPKRRPHRPSHPRPRPPMGHPRPRPPRPRPPEWAPPKPRPRPGKRPLKGGHCGAIPRGWGCDEDAEKWFNNPGFYTCSKVKAGRCPTIGEFFDSCEACQQKCMKHRKNVCAYKG